MSKLKHTPGPWVFDPEDKTIYSAAEDRAIAVCEMVYDEKTSEDEFNARLIAAALDMYAILRRAADGYPIQDAAYEIVAKLEGYDD